jgi:pimeloyl-ACP methyl ester carboxylesterase
MSTRGSRVVRFVALCAVVIGVGALGPPAAVANSATDIPVSFGVQNVNRSQVPCASDGVRYVVSGHLVGPASVLSGPSAPAVTVYLHGLDINGGFWHLTTEPDYDYAAQLAKDGQVSLVIDRLGYGKSGSPPGFSSCVGAQADVAHQIVGQLRQGTYSAGSAQPVSFAKVAVAGHSISGAIAQVEAYSFHDTDALLVLSWSDTGSTQQAQTSFVKAGLACATNGPYAYFGQTVTDYQNEFFYSATPDVRDAVLALRSVNPCGDMGSVPQTIAADEALVGSITLPVLLVSGQNDAVFSPDGTQRQRDMYTGSRDVTLDLIPNTGHALPLEATAPTFRATINNWLTAHGI